jgi:hypothetical protein
MTLINAYPDKKQVPYKKTVVPLISVVEYMQTIAIPVEIIRSAYFMFRNESANGRAGINNNYIGMQADGAHWPSQFDSWITGVVTKKENNGEVRLFLALSSWKNSIDILLDRVESRGLYVGGFERLVTKRPISEQTTLQEAYRMKWIGWLKGYTPTAAEEAAALDRVNVVLGYLRSWVTGKADFMPKKLIVKNLGSMYKQARLLFPQNNLTTTQH